MNRKRIILVDDEGNVLDGLRRILRKYRNEWDMTFVTSGAEALARMEQGRFDVIITDMQMPQMTGAELLQHVADRFPNTARIVLSGHADERMTRLALKNAHQYLAKPVDAEVIRTAIARACTAQTLVHDEGIRLLVGSYDAIPTAPTLYLEIASAVEANTADAKTIAGIISRDPAMTAKVLQLVNSSFFGIARRVSSVEQSVSLLGNSRIKALVLAEHVFKRFITSPLGGISVEELWSHSFKVGMWARMITLLENPLEDRPDQAFTAGLLHDIGIVLLAARDPKKYQAVLDAASNSQTPLTELEKAAYGANHADVGAYLLSLWALPPRIIEGVAKHHHPSSIPYDGVCAATAVHAADAFSWRLEHPEETCPRDPLGGELDMDYLQRISLVDRLGVWLEHIENCCGEAEAIYQ